LVPQRVHLLLEQRNQDGFSVCHGIAEGINAFANLMRQKKTEFQEIQTNCKKQPNGFRLRIQIDV
jgi:hypothetical protein